MNARAVVRAALLDNLLMLTTGAPVLDLDQSLWYAKQRMTALDVLLLDRVREEDLGLLNACLAVECALREAEFAAVERLLALVAGGEGSLTERILALPDAEQVAALAGLYEVGWVYTD